MEQDATDSYNQRLAAINDSQAVVAQEDICNDEGGVLVKQGQAIDNEVVNRIVRFKLLRPLESSVAIENSLTSESVMQTVQAITEHADWASSLFVDHYKDAIERACRQLDSHPLLVQKLTVMSLQMPEDYRKSVYSACICLMLAAKMELGETAQQEVFLAALVHDIGMLHIPEEIVNKTSALTPQEWRAIQSHVVIGSKILQQIPGIPATTALAVLQHHERADHSGYPQGLGGDDIHIYARLIGMSDTVISIVKQRLQPNGMGGHQLIPILQMNSQLFGYQTFAAVTGLLKQLQAAPAQSISHDIAAALVDSINDQNARLSLWYRLAEQVTSQLHNTSQGKLWQQASSILIFLSKEVRGSGILDSGFLRWLTEVRQQQIVSAYHEIEEVFLMLGELRWHLERLLKILLTLEEQGHIKDEEIKQAIQPDLAAMQRLAGSTFPRYPSRSQAA